MIDTDEARRNMIRQQVRCWEVFNSRVLHTLASIPREHFVPERYQNLAFADTMLPLDDDTATPPRQMLSPKIEGRILEALVIRPAEQVLIVGTGSGYLTACCADLARHVTSVDVSPELIAAAERRLADLGIGNADLSVQEEFSAPGDREYDVIAITGSLPVYDPRIESWLRPGGRAFVFIGTGPAMEAGLVECSASREISYRSLFETRVPPLPNAPPAPAADLLA